MKLTTYTITPEHYPELLKQIHPKPNHLDVAGTIPSDNYKFLCVVGSRTPSPYGIEACRKIILGLQGQPVVIVSGMAIGIDSIAHEAALEAGLKTIAFPGSGLSLHALYPASRRNLAEKIINSGGGLISPFPKDQTGAIWTFPIRNRLMAGISHATLIIEGRKGSGTLGTATYATELNRNVLIIPGSIFSELSYGPLLLMKEGATPVTCAEEVMNELTFSGERLAKVVRSPERLATTLGDIKKKELARLAGTAINKTDSLIRYDINKLSLSPEEKMIMENLKNGTLSATDLIEKTSLSTSMLNITISELEMKNLVVQEGGSYRMKV
jgi:DNA processing protein